MRKLKWGILSTARIGLEDVIPAIQTSENSEVVAMASRNQKRAEQAAAPFGIPTVYGSYEDLIADPKVEAIYNPLPNHLHVPWSIRALEAGKHVLCEKPIGRNAFEIEQLIEEANRYPELKVMEAIMYRFHPQWVELRELLDAERIGELVTVHSIFTYDNVDPENYRNVPEYGGGGLLDVGGYSISSSRWIFGMEPQRVFGEVKYDPIFGIDRLASAILDFGGATATFSSSPRSLRYQRADVYGTMGRLEIETPFNPPDKEPALSQLFTAEGPRELLSPVANQYQLMVEAFADSIYSSGEVPITLQESLANMRVIDAVFESGRTGSWVTL